MTETSNAEKLRISDGFVVWIIGSSIEGASVIDPLPEGAVMIETRTEDEPDSVDAAIVFADDRTQLADSFDDALPQLGSIPLVWITYPFRDADVDEDTIQELDRRLRLVRRGVRRSRRHLGCAARRADLRPVRPLYQRGWMASRRSRS